ncbi:unnamed protein product [Amaranthus hypochondriacus]
MGSVRNTRERKGEKAFECFGTFPGFPGSRRVTVDHLFKNTNYYPQRSIPQRSFHGYWAGHRWVARRPMWLGPRVPPRQWAGHRQGGAFTLFIDGIPKKTTWFELKNIFSEIGVVVDSYISKKQRKGKAVCFGFVRFHHRWEADKAIKRFNGLRVFGNKLHVSMAKYQRGGIPVVSINALRKNKAEFRLLKQPSNSRRCSDDVTGGKRKEQESNVNPVEKENSPTGVSNSVDGVDFKTDHEGENSVGNGTVSNPMVAFPLVTLVENSKTVDDNSNVVTSEKELPLPYVAATGEGLNDISSQTLPSAPSPKKRVRKVLTNSRDIANFLGYYSTSTVVPQKALA